MTVSNTTYSYLEEAWGETFEKTKKSKSKKRDATCDTFAKSMAKFDDIMDVYATPPSSEYYDKTEFSRTQRHLPDTDAEDRETEVKTLRPNMSSKQDYRDHFEELPTRTTDDKLHLDFGMYLFSGVILIFIMEQFVQIGLNMRRY